MRGTDKGLPKLQLRGVNKALRTAYGQHLELVKGEGYFYFVYDDEKAKIYETESVMVNALNHMTLESWLYDARQFLKRIGVYNG